MLSSNHLAKCHILMIIEINETTAEQLESLWHILLRHNYVHYLGPGQILQFESRLYIIPCTVSSVPIYLSFRLDVCSVIKVFVVF